MYQSLILPSQARYASSGSLNDRIQVGETDVGPVYANRFLAECFGTDQ